MKWMVIMTLSPGWGIEYLCSHSEVREIICVDGLSVCLSGVAGKGQGRHL